jgi:hypothetical protein
VSLQRPHPLRRVTTVAGAENCGGTYCSGVSKRLEFVPMVITANISAHPTTDDIVNDRGFVGVGGEAGPANLRCCQ